ncbi:hypothetical protein ABVT39_017208 [Epinephelus coioides]
MQKITSLRMLPWVVKQRWMFVAILLCGMFVNNSRSHCPDTNNNCTHKNVLFVSTRLTTVNLFPSKAVYNNANGTKLCFNILNTTQHADCCNTTEFDCHFNISDKGNEKYKLILNEKFLSKQDIVVMTSPDQKYNCSPSQLYNTSSDFFFQVHKCLNKDVKNFRLSQNDLCGNTSSYNDEACTAENNSGTFISPENAAKVMSDLSTLLNDMGNHSAASITMGKIKGVIAKLPPEKNETFSFGIKTTGDMNILEGNTDAATGFSRSVVIPTEAIARAVNKEGSFAAVLLFPGMHQDDPESHFFNDEVVGIEMGIEISQLSHTIDIHYKSVEKNGSIASCRSWDGKGKANWITDGCETKVVSDSVTCQCSHLTFFAILLSPAPGNISASDLKSLTYITSVGCGLSMFFLAVGLFMYCLIRKGKASQATKILMNLFVAMFNLNLSFLVNETIAKMGNFNACVAVAAVMHYTMLATFSWFFIQALHLYFNMWRVSTEAKHYIIKMCVAGWVTPAVVVIALLATRQYDNIVINSDDGNSAEMCWIPDAVIHQGVNIGYYGLVFIFTFGVFVLTVRQIMLLKPKAGKAQDYNSIKTNSFSIFGLFLLLGITWAFAFFSYGPLRIPSYYIFTILNSFQGFFLFIYYYNSSKFGPVDRPLTITTSSTTTTKTVVSPLQ